MGILWKNIDSGELSGFLGLGEGVDSEKWAMVGFSGGGGQWSVLVFGLYWGWLFFGLGGCRCFWGFELVRGSSALRPFVLYRETALSKVMCFVVLMYCMLQACEYFGHCLDVARWFCVQFVHLYDVDAQVVWWCFWLHFLHASV